MKISEDVQNILNAAYADAKDRGSEYITPEHLMYAALYFESVEYLLEQCGVDAEVIKEELSRHIDEAVPVLEGREPVQTIGFQGVIERALIHSQSSQTETVDVGDLLVSLFDEENSYASYLMRREGLTRLVLTRIITDEDFDSSFDQEESDDEGAEPGKKRRSALESFTRDLTHAALDGELEPLIGRNEEIEQVLQVFCRKLKNNPILVGDPGVGKTALAEGLAARLAEGNVPEKLQGFRLFSLDVGTLLAGTRFRGDFEERLQNIIAELLKMEHCILFIDEIHTIMGAGAVSGGSVDAASMLKPVIASGKLRCLGSSTYDEYKKYFDRDRALSRRFHMIEIRETDPAQTISILKGLKKRFEDFHKVKITDKAIRAAVDLSNEYINERWQPDKAIDVIDEAGAALQLHNFRHRKKRKVIEPSEIQRIVAKIANVPEASVSMTEKLRLQHLETDLLSVIYGQNDAVHNVVEAVKRSRAGFQQPDKPVASLLFVGPTGVGKTELARQLAGHLGIAMHRFDMSEYQEEYTVSRLIGSAPGYVGYEEGGQLTDAVRRTPHAVLLLDEIEKAHWRIFNIFLQIMDYATLTDNQGRKADFRNVILIMTSNAGARDISKPPLGFTKPGGTRSVVLDAVEKVFQPEFRNRLDRIVVFNNLDEQVILRIVDKEIREFEAQLAPKGISLTVSDACRKWLAEKGYSPEFGARNIKRLVQDKIKTFFVDSVLFGELINGGNAIADLKDGDVSITVKE
ncbi:MAG: ATP-dependent Clp protease ATP-binding subunit ClpA [Spirochaetales bacterium]|nr:ATP-dependent Clp protease ATP-binding subunit ClpA [Spirochaetales bacterium]